MIEEEGVRREKDKRDIAKADQEVLKRVLCGATDQNDFEYLTERLKQVTP